MAASIKKKKWPINTNIKKDDQSSEEYRWSAKAVISFVLYTCASF